MYKKNKELDMYRNMKILIVIISISILSNIIYAQGFKISGTVKDASTGEKLFGANIILTDLSIGASTNADGNFIIENVRSGVYELTASYIGYIKRTKNIQLYRDTKIDFSLEPRSVVLDETVVKGTKAVLRETPVAFSEIKGEELEFKLASRDIPQALATTPSVYSSVSGGGAGDANLYVRGFSQRNVAVMVNGVPVNDMENKWVYW